MVRRVGNCNVRKRPNPSMHRRPTFLSKTADAAAPEEPVEQRYYFCDWMAEGPKTKVIANNELSRDRLLIRYSPECKTLNEIFIYREGEGIHHIRYDKHTREIKLYNIVREVKTAKVKEIDIGRFLRQIQGMSESKKLGFLSGILVEAHNNSVGNRCPSVYEKRSPDLRSLIDNRYGSGN